MKKYLLVLPFFLLLFAVKSKAQTAPDTADYPYWIDMMQNDTVNFFAVQKAFYTYYAKHHDEADEEKHEAEGEEEDEGFALFKRWEYMTRRRINPDGSRKPGDQTFNEFVKYKAKSLSKNTLFKGAARSGTNPTGDWTSLGPTNLPNNAVFQPNGMGRINAIAFDPAKKGTIYVGSPGGGLWVTKDSGSTWATLTDQLATLGVSAIVVDPTSTSTIYIGTGDRDNNDAPGLGVMKSTNGGSTWRSVNATMGSVTVTKIIMSPSNSKILLAATSGGIFRSTDSAHTWTRTSANTFYYKDIVFKPHHPNVVYATESGAFFRSTNGGVSFSQITKGLSSAFRGVIAVTPADTNRVYFITTGSIVFNACYVSTDGGTSFRTKSTSPNIMDYSDNGSGAQGQAFYDLCVIADTANSAALYVGGINIFKSTDSGTTWTAVAHWVGSGLPAIHADQHVFAINPLNNKLFVGNDGGVYYSPDAGTTWTTISSGLSISEIYKIGQSATRQDLMMAGFQDNGSSQLNNGKWNFILGGDGMECAVDPIDTNYQYAEIYYGDMYQSSDAGKTFYTHLAGNGTNGITEAGDWVTPYVISKSNNSSIYAGYANLWRCLNTKASSPTWTKITNNLAGSNSELLEVTEQSAADTNVFYLSRNDDRLFLSSNINAASPHWTDLTSTLPNSNSLVVDVKTHPKYPHTLYIIQNDNIYLSKDTGSHWTNISGSLPAISLNTIVIDKNSYSGLYLGTDAGVYYRDSTMSDWTPFYSGLPTAARVMELEIYYDAVKSANNKIKGGTYGRGAWISDLYSPVSPVAAFSVNNSAECLKGNSFSFTDNSTISSGNISAWSWDFGDLSTKVTTQNPKHTYASAGTYTVKLIVTSSLGTTDNTSKTITVYPQSVPSFTVNTASQCLTNNSFTFTDKTTLSSGTLSWAWNFGDLGTSPSQNPTHAYTTAGKYKVLLTVTTNNNCTDTVSKFVTVYPQPTASFNTGTLSQCLAGNSFSFNDGSHISSGSIASWAWDFGDLGTSTSQNPPHAYKIAGAFTVKLTVTSNNGCTDNTTKSITIYPQPTANFGINTTVQCLSGNSYVFTDKTTIASSSSISTWAWDFGDGNTAATQNTSHSYTTAGTYRVKLTATSNNGCVDTISFPMKVFPQPVAGFSVNTNPQCMTGNSFAFTDKTTISSGNITWAWDFGDGNTSASQNPTNVYAAAGTYRVKLMATTSFGCTDTTSQLVTVNPEPVSGFTINTIAQCYKGNSFVLTDKSTVSSGKIATWAWQFGDGNSSASQSPTHAYALAGTYTIKLKVTTNNGCTDSINKPITVYPTPVVGFVSDKSSSCFAGNSFAFTDKTTISTGTLSTWAWDFGDANISTSQNAIHAYTKPGTYKVKLKVTSNSNCFDTASKFITVYPQTTIGFTVNNAHQCFAANSFSFTDKSTLSTGKIASWAWNFGDGNVSANQSASHNYGKAGAYAVQLKTTTDKGCIDSTNDTIKVYAMPAPAIIGDTAQCARSSSAYRTKNDSGSSYAWQVTGGNIVSGIGTDSIVVNWPTFAFGNVSVVETNFNNCKDSATMNVLVQPAPVANIKSFGKVCAGKALNFVDSSSGNNKYSWDFGDIASRSTHSDTSSLKNPAHSFEGAGTYTVKLYVVNNYGCSDSTSKIAAINPLPNPHWTLDYLSNQAVLHANDSTLNDTSYHWTFGDGATGTGHSARHLYATNKSYNVNLRLTNTLGCVNEFDSTVDISKSTIENFESPDIKLTVYPNPFQNATTLEYELVQNTKVNIRLYDVTGKEVAVLVQETQSSGVHKYEINSAKYSLVPGMYFLKVMLNDQFVSKHIVKL